MPKVSQANQKDTPLTPSDLKHFMRRHHEAAKTLKRQRKYGMVAYHLGYALEFALKACICKHLGLPAYPTQGEDGKFFKSHSFQRLYMLSGLHTIFDRTKEHGGLYDSFVQEYVGDDWTRMRYDRKTQKYLSDKRVATRLHNTLIGHGRSAPKSIIGIIKRRGLW